MINEGKVLIIGAGGVGRVVAHKCTQNPDVFKDICLASRTLEKCREISWRAPVSSLNSDTGVALNTNLAITSLGSIDPLVGRLSAPSIASGG